MPETPDDDAAETGKDAAPGAPVSYEHLNRLLGVTRAPMKTLIAAHRAGKGMEGVSAKERTAVLEAQVMDVLHARVARRRADPRTCGVHGLAVVEGFGPHIARLCHPERGWPTVPARDAIRSRPVLQEEFDMLADDRDRPLHMRGYDVVEWASRTQVNTLLLETHRWETERAELARERRADPEGALYAEYAAAVAEYKPETAPAGCDYPAVRKLTKGYMFGLPFQWGVISRFPGYARDLGMPWNAATFDALMEGFSRQAKRAARVHGTILALQGQMLAAGGMGLAGMIECRRDGDRVEFYVQPHLMRALAETVAEPETAEALRSMDGGPVTDCTALHSDIFDGTLVWNAAIAKDLMVP